MLPVNEMKFEHHRELEIGISLIEVGYFLPTFACVGCTP
jgi:hypothetical protein